MTRTVAQSPASVAAPSSARSAGSTSSLRAARQSQNANKVSDYVWAEEVLQLIVGGNARGICTDVAAGAKCSPVFIVAGACPNRLCGMQAVLFACMDSGTDWPATSQAPRLDFWWIKPLKKDPLILE